jgi:hypothetical protein
MASMNMSGKIQFGPNLVVMRWNVHQNAKDYLKQIKQYALDNDTTSTAASCN